jgi:hypothetical protein
MGVSLTRLVKWIRVICFSSLLLWKRKISSVEKKKFYSRTQVLLMNAISKNANSLAIALINGTPSSHPSTFLLKNRQVSRTSISQQKHLPKYHD